MASTLLWQSCDTFYPDTYYDTSETRITNSEKLGLYAITPTLNYNSLFYISATRGMGAFDRTHYPATFQDIYLASRFYVLAYRHTQYASGGISSPSSYSTLRPANAVDCLVSTQLSSPSSTQHRGKLSQPTGLDGTLQFLDDSDLRTPTPYYWNNDYSDVGYKFFAYYLDDAIITNAQADNDHVLYNVTIDGSQDVMTGYAPELTMDYMHRKYKTLTDDVDAQIIHNGNGQYSTYAAQHGVQPVIDVRHLLTRFKFAVMLKDTIDMLGRHDSITVTGIRMKGNSNVAMYVAARDTNEMNNVVFADTPAWFDLRHPATVDDNGNITKGKTLAEQPVYLENATYTDKAVDIGESILLASDTEYDVEIDYKQNLLTKWTSPNWPKDAYEDVYHDNIHYGTEPAKVSIKMKDGNRFLPGYTYYVTLRIYGDQRIDITVSLEPWKQGGQTEVIVAPQQVIVS